MEVRSEPSFSTMQNSSIAFIDSIASQSLNANTEERVKRKRGRPRKYASSDGSRGILSPDSSSGFTISSSGDLLESKKKRKSKILGWGKKSQMKALGSSGIGFTPHVISVKTGEDVSSKIMSFSNHGPRAVCILSANGAISNVTIRQAASSGGTVAYEGRFEILSLSGSFLPSESFGQRNRTGGLSVSLAGSDGHVLGGGVAGPLIAATPVQVVVGSFIAEGGGGGGSGGSGSGPKEPPQQMIPLAGGDSATENPTQGGMPAPSVPGPIYRGALSPPSGGSPHNQSTNGGDGNNHDGNNSKGLLFMPWQ